MSNDNFKNLLDKYYAGTASAEEIQELTEENLIDKADEHYAAAMVEARIQKMDWTFEDFLESTPKVKTVAAKKRRTLFSPMLKIAASVVLILSTYFVWQKNQSKEIEAEYVTTEKIVTNPPVAIKPLEVLIQEAGQVKAEKADASTKSVRKKSNPLLAKKVKQEQRIDINTKEDNYLVIVNGRKIYNEEEAIEVASKSMAMVSRSLMESMDEVLPVTRMKIKL